VLIRDLPLLSHRFLLGTDEALDRLSRCHPGVADGSQSNYRIALIFQTGTITVEVAPIALQKRSGYAALIPLHPGEMDLPGWIAGKTDLLQVAIHEQLRAYVAGN